MPRILLVSPGFRATFCEWVQWDCGRTIRRETRAATDVDVTVDEGRVSLGGTMPTRTEARLLEELARRLDGVVSVDSSLEWKLDDTVVDKGAGPHLPRT